LWIDPNDPQRMINSNDGGANVSVNGGQTWTEEDYPTRSSITWPRPKTFLIKSAALSRTTAPSVCRACNTRARNVEMYAVGGGESGYIAPSPVNPNVFYAGSQGALITRYDRSTGETRDIQPYPRFFSGEPSSALKERWQWTFPIVFLAARSKDALHFIATFWKTVDDGQSWTTISPDLTKADPKTLGLSGGPITGDMNGPEVFGRSLPIAPSRIERGTIWTGSDDGLVFITRDEGNTGRRSRRREYRSRARQLDRCVAAQSRHGIRRGEELSAGRSRALTSFALRITARPGQRSSTGLSRATMCTPCARTQSGRACSTPALSMASMSRSTTAITGSRYL
jgi:hypothetical protein